MEGEEDIGFRFSCIRVGEQLSQAQFAASLGISHRTYTHIETGSRNPSAETLVKLHEVYRVNPSWILLGIGLPRIGEESEALLDFLKELDAYIDERKSSVTRETRYRLIKAWFSTLKKDRLPMKSEFDLLLQLAERHHA